MKVIFFDQVEVKVLFGELLLNKGNFLLLRVFFEFAGHVDYRLCKHDSLRRIMRFY